MDFSGGLMPSLRSSRDCAFDRPGKYRIRVKGFLDETWSERLADMTIRSSRQGSQAPVTTLVGELRDQAELSGVLNTLYELHLPLLSVELLAGEKLNT
jgi:hypothetical protein